MSEKLRVLVLISASILLRWCVAYHPYSGEDKPPMFGDYEAQRHWQEITLNLPISSWYTNSSANDMLYWGLDYPPLTAYHSFVIARVAHLLDPKYTELHKSRGFESESHKYFMRFTVILSDILLYIPAIVYFVSRAAIQESLDIGNVFGFKKRDYILATALLYPGIILIDHGHFQYNCVSLGLFVAAVAAILRNSSIVASFLFVLALNYKQMELYHALPFFFYILGNNTPGRRKSPLACLKTLICVSLSVILTFIVIWAPFTEHWDRFSDAVARLFPFGRGVFEDKVANVWCAVNVVYKLRETFTNIQLARICLIITATAVFPSCIDLYMRPIREKFVVSLINSSLAFYLFSFQVHEKTILLVAVPVLLYFHKDPLPCFWFLIISTFSMLPLFIKDGLSLAFFSLTAFYTLAVFLMWSREFEIPAISDCQVAKKHKDSLGNQRKSKTKHGHSMVAKESSRLIEKLSFFINTNPQLWNLAKISTFRASLIGAAVLSIASVTLNPPIKYPDLLALLVSIYSCGHFCAFFLYFNYKQICVLRATKAKAY